MGAHAEEGGREGGTDEVLDLVLQLGVDQTRLYSFGTETTTTHRSKEGERTKGERVTGDRWRARECGTGNLIRD